MPVIFYQKRRQNHESINGVIEVDVTVVGFIKYAALQLWSSTIHLVRICNISVTKETNSSLKYFHTDNGKGVKHYLERKVKEKSNSDILGKME